MKALGGTLGQTEFQVNLKLGLTPRSRWLTWVRSGCLEHVWDELLVVVMRSSAVLVMVAEGWAGFRVSGGP